MRSEFEFIRNIKDKYGLNGIGDDCAVLPKDPETDLLITADLLVEDIDFRLDWTTPQLLGHKALAVSISDIAAMGGTPKWAMLSIGVPEKIWSGSWVDQFYEGWHRLAKREHVELVGGDTSRTTDKVVIDSIVGGEVPVGGAVLRSGAKEGDAIAVTFRVGGSAGGLKLLQDGYRIGQDAPSWKEALVTTHLEPWPQSRIGPFLQQHHLATSMIDISDGLASDLMHICRASKVGGRLTADAIPLNLNLVNLFSSFEERLPFALDGGEDFQLLFTLPKDRISELSSIGVDDSDEDLFTVIGEVTANTEVIELVGNRESKLIEPKGYRHF